MQCPKKYKKKQDSPWQAVRLSSQRLVHTRIALLASRWVFQTIPTNGAFITDSCKTGSTRYNKFSSCAL